jgi:hypothetical protein
MHHPKYRMSVNDWYTFRDKIQGNYKAFPHITAISRKSNSQRIQNWLYISILLIFMSRLHNYQKWCLPYRKAFAWLSVRKQIHTPVFSVSCDFFLWCYVQEQAFVPPLPLDVDKLKLGITTAIETTDRNMLERVWNELDYGLDICRVTNGAHIEHP